MGLRVLVLEDDHSRIVEFKKRFSELADQRGTDVEVTYEETAAGCISRLEGGTFDMLFLDHDLGGDVLVSTQVENTGSGVARFIAGRPELRPKNVITHSLNPVGRKNISDLTGAVEVPFVWAKTTFHARIQ